MMELANKRIYLSGPMTGMHDWNRETFIEAARYLRNQGARVFNPAFTAPAAKEKAKSHSFYMLRDLHELTSYVDDGPLLGAVHAAEILPDVRRSGGRCDEKGAQTMSFGDGNLHVQVAQLKTENARLKQRNGELRALVRDLIPFVCADDGIEGIEARMKALGIEVDA